MSDVSLEKTERSSERETNSLRIRTECFDLMTSRDDGDMEVRVVDLANRTGYALTEEFGH